MTVQLGLKQRNIYNGTILKKIAIYALIALILLVFIVPFYWMIVSAFKSRQDLFGDMFPFSFKLFIAANPTMGNFIQLFREFNFIRPLLNSLGISTASVLISTSISCMIAYVLVWIDFPGRKLIFMLILSTMLISLEAKLVPLFLIAQKLGIYNTYFVIIAPWLTDAYFIFMLRQHFMGIPQALFDAAVVDGCSYYRIFWNVMLPNIKPGIVSAVLIKFIFSWDAYMWPLIAVSDENKNVINIAIAGLFTDDKVLWELIFAGSAIATLPVLILFLFLQKYFIKGFVSSGMKE